MVKITKQGDIRFEDLSEFIPAVGKAMWCNTVTPSEYKGKYNFNIDLKAGSGDIDNAIKEIKNKVFDAGLEEFKKFIEGEGKGKVKDRDGKVIKNGDDILTRDFVKDFTKKDSDEVEYTYIRAKISDTKPDGEKRVIDHFDIKGIKIDDEDRKELGNGSLVKVSLICSPYYVQGVYGVSIKFTSVQIISFVENTGVGVSDATDMLEKYANEIVGEAKSEDDKEDAPF